ncbi:hypothetical protein BH18THE2_BH18THE2_28530 [soil metagenome]
MCMVIEGGKRKLNRHLDLLLFYYRSDIRLVSRIGLFSLDRTEIDFIRMLLIRWLSIKVSIS